MCVGRSSTAPWYRSEGSNNNNEHDDECIMGIEDDEDNYGDYVLLRGVILQ